MISRARTRTSRELSSIPFAGPKKWYEIGDGHFGLLITDLFFESRTAQLSFLRRWIERRVAAGAEFRFANGPKAQD
jgi:hypothetical protein